MTSQTLSDIYNYAAFSYEYYNAATQTSHGQVNQHHHISASVEMQGDPAQFYGQYGTQLFLLHFYTLGRKRYDVLLNQGRRYRVHEYTIVYPWLPHRWMEKILSFQ